jgi:hypothetical protein
MLVKGGLQGMAQAIAPLQAALYHPQDGLAFLQTLGKSVLVVDLFLVGDFC